MLSELSTPEFSEWMAFYIAEARIYQEQREQTVLENEALSGAQEIRERMRS